MDTLKDRLSFIFNELLKEQSSMESQLILTKARRVECTIQPDQSVCDVTEKSSMEAIFVLMKIQQDCHMSN
jgi:hypothetical protein